MDLKKAGFGLAKELGAISWGTITGSLKLFWNVLEGASRQLMKFHEEGIAFARDMGMSLNQAQAYTKALTTNTKKLAFEYGVTSEAIMKIQRGLSEATSRQLFLNQAQTEHFLQLNKLAGEASVSKFAEEMMNGMGAQVDAVEGAIAKAYATATKSGLSAKKTTEVIANSLNLVNKLSFRNGVDGLTKMAMQAQKIGMSLQSVESVAKTFMDFEGSIEHAAQLQMLGGAAGAFGGNPLDMMYEANYDPEALQDRMSKMLGGYAQFNAKTGMSNINGMGMDFIRNIAKAMGMDEGEAVKTAKKQAELKYKEQQFGGRFRGFSQEQQDLIMNRSYVRDGKLYINDAGGKEHDITNGVDETILKELHQWDGKSDREIMEIQAKSLTSINERIEGLIETIKSIFAEKFADYVPKIQRWIEKNGGKLVEKTMAAAEWLVKEGPKVFNSIVENVKKGWEIAKQTWAYIKKYFPLFLTALAAYAVGKIAKGGLGRGAKAPAGAGPKGGTPSGGGAVPGSGKPSKTDFLTKGTDKNGREYYRRGNKPITKEEFEAGKKAGEVTRTKASNGQYQYHQNGTHISEATAKANVPKPNPAKSSNTWWDTAKKFGGKAKNAAKVGGKVAKVGGLAAAFGAIEGLMAKGEYDEAERQIMLDTTIKKEDKIAKLKEIRKRRNEAYGSAAGAAALSTAGALIPIPGVNVVASIGGGILGDWLGGMAGGMDMFNGDIDDKEFAELVKKYKGESYAKGGPVSGAKGEPQLAVVHGQESVWTPEMQKTYFPAVQSMPVGRNDFNLEAIREEISKVGDSTVTVKDFRINLGGTLKLDGGGSTANLNLDSLMRDPVFIEKIQSLVTEGISSSYNGGRKMNDIATMRGMVAQTTTIGRRST